MNLPELNFVIVDKYSDKTVHRIRVIDENTEIEFKFSSETPDKNASGVISTYRGSADERRIGVPKKKTEPRARQRAFCRLLRVMATMTADGIVPKVFNLKDGTTMKLDQSCSEWAAESGEFEVRNLGDIDGICLVRK